MDPFKPDNFFTWNFYLFFAVYTLAIALTLFHV
jgi:hypothetical protein